jgi:hypothetical protein
VGRVKGKVISVEGQRVLRKTGMMAWPYEADGVSVGKAWALTAWWSLMTWTGVATVELWG